MAEAHVGLRSFFFHTDHHQSSRSVRRRIRGESLLGSISIQSSRFFVLVINEPYVRYIDLHQNGPQKGSTRTEGCICSIPTCHKSTRCLALLVGRLFVVKILICGWGTFIGAYMSVTG
jgi:hypothetical protein